MNETLYPVAAALRGRRTIHEFLPKPVPRAAIRAAVDLARWAPNHRNTDPWRFYVLGPQTIAAVTDLYVDLTRAAHGEEAAVAKRARWATMPGWLVVTAAKSHNDALRNQEDYAACCCAVENLALALWEQGIGLKWSTGEIVRSPRLLTLLGADPVLEKAVGLFWYGYPAVVPEQRRRPMEEILRELP
jgi:nitroreductase